jgi:hypothetical protein
MAGPKVLTVTLRKTREAKNTVRFEPDGPDVMGTLYVTKTKLDELGNPETLSGTFTVS